MNQKIWESVTTSLMNELKEGEALALSLAAENSLFVRMTQAKVRQSTEIEQGTVELNFFKKNKNVKATVPFTFHLSNDLQACRKALNQCRKEAEHLPDDPFLQLPENQGKFHQEASHKSERYLLVDRCLSKVQHADFVGILTTGEVVRANMTSAGTNQWFGTSTFSVDFSLYTAHQQAVKGLYGGQQWSDEAYEALISKKLNLLDYLKRPLMALEKKKYRTYFSPSAVANLLDSLCRTPFVSREAYERGDSPLKKLVDGQETLSPLLTLQENFSSGGTPRFNKMGELAPEILGLIEKGQFKNFLCSSRSAKEYGVTSNFANLQEILRSPEILPGRLLSEKETEVLGTGLYVSNLHYLNWSNIQTGSITGMTRFGCFWVEDGQIVAPVKDLRFDESLYHFWGQGLEGFTDKMITFPHVETYFNRNLGAVQAPGMLVNDFRFVL